MNVSASLSGLNAAQFRLDVAANNIANISSQNFTRQDVIQSNSANGGVNVSVRSSTMTDNSLEADMVDQLQSVYLYKANLSVLKKNIDLMGFLIDTKA